MMHWCVELGIPVLSVYVFSLENWKRPKEEVDSLGKLAEYYFDRYQEFADNNIKVVISGVEDNFEKSTVDKIERIQRETSHCTGLTLNLCANYSGRREIIDAVAKGAKTEEEITAALYQNLPEPELIVRTGGFQRLSNFLMWQSAYSELYFTDTLFPDFSFGEFKHAVKRYYGTKRKFGGE
jgi:undecaprenyl diphosphate synthase